MILLWFWFFDYRVFMLSPLSSFCYILHFHAIHSRKIRLSFPLFLILLYVFPINAVHAYRTATGVEEGKETSS